jgi:hypothetical protein
LRLKENSDAHALLVGDGPLRKSLEIQALPFKERIHFTGFLNQSRLPEVYKASNVLILPSNSNETWGLVVNEAFACGIPAVVSDAAGCAPDLIDERETGFTYPAGNVQTLAQKAQTAKRICEKDPEKFKQSINKKLFSYSMTKATEGLEAAIDKFLKRSRTKDGEKTNILVMGMGAFAFGREKRAVEIMKYADRISPYFIVSRWQDGSVGKLLERYGFSFTVSSVGYLGRKKIFWT